jgi:hypothetical protein
MRLSADIAGVRFQGRYVTWRTVRAGIGAPIGSGNERLQLPERLSLCAVAPPGRNEYFGTPHNPYDKVEGVIPGGFLERLGCSGCQRYP